MNTSLKKHYQIIATFSTFFIYYYYNLHNIIKTNTFIDSGYFKIATFFGFVGFLLQIIFIWDYNHKKRRYEKFTPSFYDNILPYQLLCFLMGSTLFIMSLRKLPLAFTHKLLLLLSPLFEVFFGFLNIEHSLVNYFCSTVMGALCLYGLLVETNGFVRF